MIAIEKESISARPFIPWPGGKEKLAPYIHKIMPPVFDRYVEPFGGSGAILLGLPSRSGRLDVYNDLDRDLVNLFLCVKYRLVALCRELGFYPLHSRAEFEVLKAALKREDGLLPEDLFLNDEIQTAEREFPPEEAKELRLILQGRAELYDVRRAAAYYKVRRGSFSGTGSSFGGKGNNILHFLKQMEQASMRLQDVVVENKDAIALIRQYDRPDGLIYCDPPYWEAERCYDVKFDMHKHLHRALRKCQSSVIVSYNNDPHILELYPDFYILGFDRPSPLAQTEGARYQELLMTNYDPRPLLEAEQVSLFELPQKQRDETALEVLWTPKAPLKRLILS